MAKNRLEKISSIEETIRQLENQRKQLLQQQKEDDRKLRTRRLIERGAILESLISDAEMLTNEQIKAFFSKTITTPYALRELENIKTQGGVVPARTTQNTQREAG